METQAYIEIRPDNLDDFQFGLVIGSLDGYLSSQDEGGACCCDRCVGNGHEA
ncbi:MAG: hypothetical protein AB4426_23945 [Xenococcaceae cyanobacterium]